MFSCLDFMLHFTDRIQFLLIILWAAIYSCAYSMQKKFRIHIIFLSFLICMISSCLSLIVSEPFIRHLLSLLVSVCNIHSALIKCPLWNHWKFYHFPCWCNDQWFFLVLLILPKSHQSSLPWEWMGQSCFSLTCTVLLQQQWGRVGFWCPGHSTEAVALFPY